LSIFKRSRKDHWELVYQKHSSNEFGWYQIYPESSLKLIKNTRVGYDCRIIDVGGGTSKLSRCLLDQGYQQLTVLDISGYSLEKAKSQLGVESNRISWIEADAARHSFNAQYDLWHDRAVFHFLTKSKERKAYLDSLNQTLRLNGHLIIATFSLDAPQKCSGLSVLRYSPETLQKELGDNFNLVESFLEEHVTPSGATQNFIYCRFIKQA